MRHARFIEQVLAITLVFALGAASMPVSAASAPAALSGRILRSATGAPLAGATVKVALRPDATLFDSARTDARGNYTLARLPSGTYDVAVEADGGLYVVGAPLALQPGESRTLGLSILPSANAAATPDGEPGKGAEGDKDKPKEPEKAKPKVKGPAKGGFFRTAWGGALIVVGSAAVIGAVVASSDNDKKTSASPSD